ncbi:IS630 family transposase [Sphaerimonospora sp. CA-214678]|uniref:IS630 family transposase n=1 Tax=Sphaerimonospora sp. CA-214678 TaxID=3240029 RepID=UPI003D91B25C
MLRARIILLLADERLPLAAVAERLSTTETTVRKWRDRFAAGGIKGLVDLPRPGRPELYGPEVRLRVIACATSTPPEGQPAWSHTAIAAHLADTGISASQAGRILAEADLRPHKVRGWLNRLDDEQFWQLAGAICDLYLNPPEGAVLLSVDEKTGIQAKSRKHPEISARPGRPPDGSSNTSGTARSPSSPRWTSAPGRSWPSGSTVTPRRPSSLSSSCSIR